MEHVFDPLSRHFSVTFFISKPGVVFVTEFKPITM
ncbi:hypothetical protein COLO4_34749 [Corchorus olitorius]|uniref:Uncharacterized protein n=1 Tax=Corchorus olitorius TaxID=93759 RepID=A0A1R3GJL8_9ROSI|nr:hypothetical protein COLO4_34749 [Corchorus olitorius]